MLLDNFITASAHMEKEEQEHETEGLLRESLSRRVRVFVPAWLPVCSVPGCVRACVRAWRRR